MNAVVNRNQAMNDTYRAVYGKDVIRIGDITIKQDVEGRYCLNDLHRAAGGEDRHQPRYWLAGQHAQEMVSILETSGIPLVSKIGRNGGTYVSKQLVYGYAMWISPAFQLKVSEAYDKLQTNGVAVSEHAAEDFLTNPMKYMRALMTQAEAIAKENTILLRKNTEVTEQRDGLVTTVGKHNRTIHKIMRMFPGVNTMSIKSDLMGMGYFYKKGNTHRVYSQYLHKLFNEKVDDERGTADIFLEKDGLILVAQLYKQGKLTMKKKEEDFYKHIDVEGILAGLGIAQRTGELQAA
jgi:hypothetical protein